MKTREDLAFVTFFLGQQNLPGFVVFWYPRSVKSSDCVVYCRRPLVWSVFEGPGIKLPVRLVRKFPGEPLLVGNPRKE